MRFDQRHDRRRPRTSEKLFLDSAPFGGRWVALLFWLVSGLDLVGVRWVALFGLLFGFWGFLGGV